MGSTARFQMALGLAIALTATAAHAQPSPEAMLEEAMRVPSPGEVSHAWYLKVRADHGTTGHSGMLSAFDCGPTGPDTASCLTEVLVTITVDHIPQVTPYYGVMHYKRVNGTWLYDEDQSPRPQLPRPPPPPPTPGAVPTPGEVSSAWLRKARADHGSASRGGGASAFECKSTGLGTASCLTDAQVTVEGEYGLSIIPHYGVMHYKLVDGTWLYDEDHPQNN